MPPIEFWVTGTALYLFVSFVFVVAVALIGIKTMISGRLFTLLIGAAVVLAFFAWRTAAIQERDASEQKKRNDELAQGIAEIATSLKVTLNANQLATQPVEKVVAAITGGDNFSFFRVMPDDLKGNGPFQLWLDATGTVYDVNYWISPASANRSAADPAYGSVDVRKPLLQIVYQGPHAWPRQLPLGDYYIEFDARNGFWIERLTLTMVDGQVREHVVVTDNAGNSKYDKSFPE